MMNNQYAFPSIKKQDDDNFINYCRILNDLSFSQKMAQMLCIQTLDNKIKSKARPSIDIENFTLIKEEDQNLILNDLKQRDIIPIKCTSNGSKSYIIKCVQAHKRFVMKVYPLKEIAHQINQIERRINLLQSINSSFLVQIYDYFQSDYYLYIKMEECLGNLEDLMNMENQQELNVNSFLKYSLEIAYGIRDLHNNGMYAINLNPKNILISHRNIAKLSKIDLLDEIVNDDQYIEQIHDLNSYAIFHPPEIFKRSLMMQDSNHSLKSASTNENNKNQQKKCDIWYRKHFIEHKHQENEQKQQKEKEQNNGKRPHQYQQSFLQFRQLGETYDDLSYMSKGEQIQQKIEDSKEQKLLLTKKKNINKNLYSLGTVFMYMLGIEKQKLIRKIEGSVVEDLVYPLLGNSDCAKQLIYVCQNLSKINPQSRLSIDEAIDILEEIPFQISQQFLKQIIIPKTYSNINCIEFIKEDVIEQLDGNIFYLDSYQKSKQDDFLYQTLKQLEIIKKNIDKVTDSTTNSSQRVVNTQKGSIDKGKQIDVQEQAKKKLKEECLQNCNKILKEISSNVQASQDLQYWKSYEDIQVNFQGKR
ncbi:kinase domain protein (macronuclear) [Tetrahymena thermophila SB210]|uniref:Kinase domain protein n=1 Tax=Tetrahymena thermophila (strain SB210) TaxID=312017 RepID=W7XHX0_TETTS|nr:kinase domain protein [Tetrahymena thermophila SB210]EWS72784.1 kinase domain protein [Tetrahymena thermophila SB210]|eukprot:XP_012654671.1 kinase domain protein [Tetrahymena thermophila SB210]